VPAANGPNVPDVALPPDIGRFSDEAIGVPEHVASPGP
jgi:hypothetical protein